MTPYLIVLCGIPASGKSTLARELRKHLALSGEWKIVSTDCWRDAEYYSDFIPEKEHRVREMALSKTSRYVSEGLSIIHDDTNYYASMRHELFSLALENEYAFGIIHITLALKTALGWNKARNNPLPEDVLTKIHDRFDIPGSRYAWDRPLLQVDLSKRSVEKIVLAIEKELKSLMPLKRSGKTKPSMAEIYDKRTRLIVKEFLQNAKNMRGNPKITEIRKDVVSEAISKDMSLDEVERLLTFKLDKLR